MTRLSPKVKDLYEEFPADLKSLPLDYLIRGITKHEKQLLATIEYLQNLLNETEDLHIAHIELKQKYRKLLQQQEPSDDLTSTSISE